MSRKVGSTGAIYSDAAADIIVTSADECRVDKVAAT